MHRHRFVHSSVEPHTNLCFTRVHANGAAPRAHKAGTQNQPWALLRTCGTKSSRAGVWKDKVQDMHKGNFSLLRGCAMQR